jgi:hypothetical protein
MEKELCFKFLEHLYKYSSGILKKQHIEEVDIRYINNEVDNFLKRLDPAVAAGYDKAGALSKVAKIKEENHADKALNVSKSLLKARYSLLNIFTRQPDDAHLQRYAKVAEFTETVKKVIIVMDLAQ